MAKLTRRRLLKETSVGVATLGVLAGVATTATTAATHTTATTTSSAAAVAASIPASRKPVAALDGPVVAHVRDLATGEIALMVGTREIVYRDPVLVMNLLQVMQ